MTIARAFRPILPKRRWTRIAWTTIPTSAGSATCPASARMTRFALIPSFPGTAPAMIMGRPAVSVSLTVRPPALPTTRCVSAMRAGISFSNPSTRAFTPASTASFVTRVSSPGRARRRR